MASTFEIAKAFKLGDTFYEYCPYGRTNHKFIVSDAPKVTEHDDGSSSVTWSAKTEVEEIDFLITSTHEHYGPKISLTPDYL